MRPWVAFLSATTRRLPSKPGDTPRRVSRIDVTWAYAANVLDLEPRGPLPTEIYWRRRGLAIGIAVVVIGIVAAVVIAFMGHNAGAKPASADKATAAQNKPVSPAPQAPPPSDPGGPAPVAPRCSRHRS